MAFNYRNTQSAAEEPQYSNYSSNPMSPSRNPNRLSGGMISSNDARAGLSRRFTTNALPSLSPMAQQRMQAAGGDNAMLAGAYGRVPPGERRIRHIESLLEQQRRIAAELEQVDDETRAEVEQGLLHERAVHQMIAQSEPTTPPEYQDSFPVKARPNRYSMNSLTSPLGAASRPNRSSTQLTSPSGGYARPYTATNGATLPSQSVPGSRRHSDDEEEDDFIYAGFETGVHRAAANPNRNSMPVTSYDRKRNASDFSSTLDPLNTTSWLFDDDDVPSVVPAKSSNKTSPQDIKTYLQVQHTADGFPKLIRREENGEFVAAPSAALDLALGKPDQQVTDRATASRHRISLPPAALSSGGTIAPLNSILATSNDVKPSANNRRSMQQVEFASETKRPGLLTSPPRNMATNGVSKIPYSTNDIPTLKSINGEGAASLTSPSSHTKTLSQATSPQQSIGNVSRVTSNSASNNRQSQDFAGIQESAIDIYSSPQSNLQAAATPFGPMHSHDQNHLHGFTSPGVPYGQPPFYGGYGMQMLNNGFNGMHITNGYGAPPSQWSNQGPAFQNGGYGGGFQQYPPSGQAVSGASRYSENNRGAAQHRNKNQHEDLYATTKIPDIVGQIYNLCKDQHGCRYLQRKLEERNPEDIQIIFDEVKDHFVELMSDPFGNYLCQRLLEYANDEQRTELVAIAAPEMTKIALNQHGTRALQRMIEYITTPEQTQLIIKALDADVVQLIQDLNGNHVIQKCLNHLSPEDAQFIFDAVGGACVIVGTHRHGCCVLQRCVDHASGVQKGALVDSIIADAFALVQDPFGNYVVQYILDLQEPAFTEPLCRSFIGNILILSKQKFSSNVVEKCIRCASNETRRMLLNEILPSAELEKMLRDNYANYVVQTAIEAADEELKRLIMNNIRPILPAIRHTPHGRRLATKIAEWDGSNPSQALATTSQSPGTMSTTSMASLPPMPTTGPHSFQFPQGSRANRMGMIGAPPAWSNGGFANTARSGYGAPPDVAAPSPQRTQDYTFLNGTHQPYQNGFSNGGYRQAPAYGHF